MCALAAAQAQGPEAFSVWDPVDDLTGTYAAGGTADGVREYVGPSVPGFPF